VTTALLIIDIQHALCSGGEAAFGIDSVIEKVNALSGRARASRSPVILIQHEEDDGPLQFGHEGWALAEGLITAAEDLRVRKRTPNSFHQTEFHQKGGMGSVLPFLLPVHAITRLTRVTDKPSSVASAVTVMPWVASRRLGRRGQALLEDTRHQAPRLGNLA
jgi:Isochorismatase family